MTHLDRSIGLLAFCVLTLSAVEVCAQATSSSASPLSTSPVSPMDLVVGGPLRIEEGRTLRLHLEVKDTVSLWEHTRGVAHALAPATAVPASPSETAPLDVTLLWSDPASKTTSVPFVNGVAEVFVPRGAARRAHYFLTWTSPGDQFSMQFPAGREGYPVEIVARSPSLVVNGTGSRDLVVFGETIPVELEVEDASGVVSVQAYHRSAGELPFSTAGMNLTSGEPRRGRWHALLPRPPGAECHVDYYVEIVNLHGFRTLYGSSEVPFRLHLPDPTSRP